MFSSTLRVAGQVARSSTVCARASTRVSLNARPVVTLVRGFASTTLARFGGGGGGYEGRAPARNGERWQERRPRAPRREPSTPTPSRVLYVGNLPYRATEEDLKELFGEAAVESVRMATLPDGRSKGFAHVTFQTQEAAKEVKDSADLEPYHTEGRDLIINFAVQRTQNSGESTRHDLSPRDRIYFRIPGTDEDVDRLLLTWKDEIRSKFTPRNQSNPSARTGFLQLSSVAVAQEIVSELNGAQVNGQTVKVNYANPAPNRDDA